MTEKLAAAQEKPNIFLEEIAVKVRRLSPSELDNKFKSWAVKEMFPGNRSFVKDGRIYGITYAYENDVRVSTGLIPKRFDETTLKLLIYNLDKAVGRFNGMAVNHGRNDFPIEIDTESIFHTFSGYQISAGETYLEQLSKSIGTEKYAAVSASVQSQFLHELVHDLREFLDQNRFRENLTQLAEFLYDPKTNEYRNETFVRASQNVLAGNMADSYDKEWSGSLKILLWEYKQLHPDFSIPEKQEGLAELFKKLPSLFGDVPQEKRDAILKKYLLMSDEDIDKRVASYAGELKLKF
jgi:hypothetical protein